MNYGDIGLDNLNSLKQALGIAVLRKSMNRDAASVQNLINSMQNTNSKIMENSVNPHLGSKIDIKV